MAAKTDTESGRLPTDEDWRVPVRDSESETQVIAGMSGRLVVLREHLGLSREEMAERLGISPIAYAALEKPDARAWRRRGVFFLVKLHRATGVSTDWICYGGPWDGPPSPVPLALGGSPLPGDPGMLA